MIVMTFGGTSVGNSPNIEQVVRLVTENRSKKIIVLSAFSGITNLLVEITNKHPLADQDLLEDIDNIEKRCLQIIRPLFTTKTYLEAATKYISSIVEKLRDLVDLPSTGSIQKEIISVGEIISTHVFQFFLQEQGMDSVLISALDFMFLDRSGEPDLEVIREKLQKIIGEQSSPLIITQGFICNDYQGSISNLKRGGSDYTASLIGAAIHVKEIQIWTDIDGMHNNDPRYVENTFSVEEISFDEAAELAYFGAKILHPQSLIPAKNNNIPVLLKNTFHPEKKGTIIKNTTLNTGVTSIAAKDGIIAFKIKSYRMLLAYGFLKKIFEVFETYKTAIDMVTTSEVAVSLTIDNPTYLTQIIRDLKQFGLVEVDQNLSIVCVAGDFSQNKRGISAKVFGALKHIPIRMISYGGSNYNISLLVKSTDKINALNSLNEHLFREQTLFV